MNSLIFFMLAGVLVLAGIVLLIMFRLHHGGRELDVEKYRRKWLEIEQMVDKSDSRSCQFAIIEADKLLDMAMKDKGIKGETMGERLKYSKETWSDRNALWSAHKLRNQIVHETDVKVDYATTRRMLASFKKALRDVRAI